MHFLCATFMEKNVVEIYCPTASITLQSALLSSALSQQVVNPFKTRYQPTKHLVSQRIIPPTWLHDPGMSC